MPVGPGYEIGYIVVRAFTIFFFFLFSVLLFVSLCSFVFFFFFSFLFSLAVDVGKHTEYFTEKRVAQEPDLIFEPVAYGFVYLCSDPTSCSDCYLI